MSLLLGTEHVRSLFLGPIKLQPTIRLALERRHCTTSWYADWAFTWTHPGLRSMMRSSRSGNVLPPPRNRGGVLTMRRTCPTVLFPSSQPGMICSSDSQVRSEFKRRSPFAPLNTSAFIPLPLSRHRSFPSYHRAEPILGGEEPRARNSDRRLARWCGISPRKQLNTMTYWFLISIQEGVSIENGGGKSYGSARERQQGSGRAFWLMSSATHYRVD